MREADFHCLLRTLTLLNAVVDYLVVYYEDDLQSSDGGLYLQ